MSMLPPSVPNLVEVNDTFEGVNFSPAFGLTTNLTMLSSDGPDACSVGWNLVWVVPSTFLVSWKAILEPANT